MLARIGVRSTESRRVLRLLAPAGRPLSRAMAGRRGRGLRDRCDERTAALVERPAPWRRGARRGPGGRIRRGARPTASRSRTRMGSLLRHELVGRAVEADLLPSARIRHHAAVARRSAIEPFMAMHHYRVALDAPAAGRAAIAAADLAAAVDSPADELAALELAISAQGERAGGPAVRGRPRPVPRAARLGMDTTRRTSRSARPRPRSRPIGRSGPRPISTRRSARPTPDRTGPGSA